MHEEQQQQQAQTAEKPQAERASWMQPPEANLPAMRGLIAAGAPVTPIIPSTMEEVWRLAVWVAKAGYAPLSYADVPRDDSGRKIRDAVPFFDPTKIAVGIMHGMEVGFSPIAALQSIAVINGMPSIWGDGALALVRSKNLLESIKEWKEGEPKTPGWTHRVVIHRRNDTSTYEGSFSWQEAMDADLTGKDTWKKYPGRMLRWRAVSWPLRDAFGDVLKGLSIREEAMDIVRLEEDASGVLVPAAAAQPVESKTYVPAKPTQADYAEPKAPEPTAEADAREAAAEAEALRRRATAEGGDVAGEAGEDGGEPMEFHVLDRDGRLIDYYTQPHEAANKLASVYASAASRDALQALRESNRDMIMTLPPEDKATVAEADAAAMTRFDASRPGSPSPSPQKPAGKAKGKTGSLL